MKTTRLFGVLASLVLTSACGFVMGSGKTMSEQRTVPEFTKVRVSDSVALTVTAGALSVVTLTGDDNLVPLLDTRVEGGVLIIEPKTQNTTFSQRTPLTAKVSIPRIDEATASGASEVISDAFAGADDVVLTASGSSSIQASGLTAKTLKVAASGASDVTAKGSAKKVTLDASGSSTIDVSTIAAKDVALSAAGASNIKAQATETVTGAASGSSDVTVTGSPGSKSVSSSGSSNVDIR